MPRVKNFLKTNNGRGYFEKGMPNSSYVLLPKIGTLWMPLHRATLVPKYEMINIHHKPLKRHQVLS